MSTNQPHSVVTSCINNKINLYAWIGNQNFGDELSPYIVSRVSNVGVNLVGEDVEHKLVGLGSIITINTLYSGSLFWGSGVLTEERELNRPKFKIFPITRIVRNYRKYQTYVKSVPQFFAIRGPLSAMRVEQAGLDLNAGRKNKSLATGDPGILMPYLYHPKKKAEHQRFKLGIVIHQDQGIVEKSLQELVQERYRDQVTVINILRQGDNELEQFVDELCACDKIASTSLHGLIVAQAYGIPVLFLQSEECPLQKHSTFKFDDYCQGVAEKNFEPYRFTLHEGLISQLLNADFRDPPNLRAACNNLLEAFPYQDSMRISSLPY